MTELSISFHDLLIWLLAMICFAGAIGLTDHKTYWAICIYTVGYHLLRSIF